MGCIHCSYQQVQFPSQTITFAYLCQALITVLYVKQVFLASKTRRKRKKKIKPAVTHPSQQCDTSLKEPCWAGHQLAAVPCSSRQRSPLRPARAWPPGCLFCWRRERGKSSRLRPGAVTALKPFHCQNASTESRNTSSVAG